MAVQFSCPECGKVLKSANPIAPGKKVKCPSCSAIFSPTVKAAAPAKKTPPPDDETMELPKTRPTAAGVKKPAPPPMEDENPDDDEDLPKKPARKPALDDEDDERPRAKSGVAAKKPLPPPSNDFGFEDEDDDDAPPLKAKGKKAPPPMDDDDDDDLPPSKVKKGAPPLKKGRPSDDDDFDDDEDERPIKKGKAKKKSNAALFIIIGAVVLVLGLGAVAAFIWPGFLKGPDNTPIGKGKGGGDKLPPAAFTGEALAYVPNDAFALIGVNPAAVRSGKISGNLYTLFAKKTEEEATKHGVKPEEVTSFLTSIDKIYLAITPGTGKPNVLAIFSSKADVEKVKAIFEAKEVPGSTFWQMKEGGLLANPHAGIFVMTDMDSAAFQTRLDTIGRNVEISDDVKTQMSKVQDAPVWGVIGSIPGLKAATGDLGGQFGKKDKGPDPMSEALDRAKAATLDVREAGGNLEAKVRIVCQDASDAKTIDKGLQELVAILPLMLGGLEGKKGMPPEAAALLKNVTSSLKVGSSGDEVWLTTRVSGADLMTLLKMVAQAEPTLPDPVYASLERSAPSPLSVAARER